MHKLQVKLLAKSNLFGEKLCLYFLFILSVHKCLQYKSFAYIALLDTVACARNSPGDGEAVEYLCPV